MKTRLAAALLAVSFAASGADREFDRLVKAVETHFGVKRTYIPLMGVASFFVKVARPEGARGFKLAVFEDLRAPMDSEDGAVLDRIMARASEGLRPMVRVRSRRDHEWTYIYTGDFGKTTKMLIAAFERDEATIVEVKVDMETLARSLENPSRMGRFFGADHRDGRGLEP